MTQTHETVTIRDGTFVPTRLSVSPGITVVWQNEDSADHRVVSVQFDDTAAYWQFRSQSLRSGDSVVYTFDSEGVYEYFCRIHGKGMCGAILVGDVTFDQSLPSE